MEKIKFTKRKALSFDKDFEVILDKFFRMAKDDKNIKETIPQNQKKKIEKTGIFSHAVKYLIKQYVDLNWGVYCKKKGVVE